MSETLPSPPSATPAPGQPSQTATAPPVDADLKSDETSLKGYRKKLRPLLKEVKALVEERNALVEEIDQQRKHVVESVAKIELAKGETDTSLAALKQKISAVTTVLAEGDAIRTKLTALTQRCEEIELAAQQAAKRSSHIEDGFKYVQAKKPEVEAAVDQITQAKAKSDQSIAASQASLAEVKSAAKAAGDAQAKAEASVLSLESAISDFAGRNAELDKQFKRVSELRKEAEDLRATVNDLLPGATSAGLASSFNKRAEEFVLSIRFWEGVALLSLAGLVAFGLVNGNTVLKTAASTGWEDIIVPVLVKAMIALPLVWLALFSARRGAVMKRVQEDYRYKASIATAFEGFKNQFSDIDRDERSPAYLLSQTVLAGLTTQPGRLYDAKHQEVTPLSAAAEALSGLTKHRKGKIRAQGVEAEFEDTEHKKSPDTKSQEK